MLSPYTCRSLFVPYFKYLLDGCVRYLTTSGDIKTSGLTRKKKKAKILETDNTAENNVSLENWQLRALVLSSLHKCFLYDTGSLKFLDTSNFQASHSLLYKISSYDFIQNIYQLIGSTYILSLKCQLCWSSIYILNLECLSYIFQTKQLSGFVASVSCNLGFPPDATLITVTISVQCPVLTF